jgi:tetratricopeptide (TPR) repeat protein
MDEVEVGAFRILVARLDESEGRFETALDRYGRLIAQDIRPVRAEAIFRTLRLLDDMNRLDPERAAELLAGVVMTWRGNELESEMLQLLSDLYFRSGSYRLGFETAKQAAEFHAGTDTISELVDRARVEFADLYLNGKADALDPVVALGIYYDFRQLTPSGARGDEMIRNLARRLIRADLLGQAAELLEYQVDERLEGTARAQVAADLSVVHIANRDPEEALRVLHDTRLENLPASLDRQRRVIEARALIDAGRNELAIDLLAEVEGRDADLLRVDAHWQGRRYREAGELLELIYAPESPGDALSHPARMSIVKAAVGYVLADDQIGLSRIRVKFGELMANSPEWPIFQLVTGEVSSSSVEFRDVAREVANLDTLSAFLNIYRERYEAGGALAPDAASAGASA